MSNYDPIVTLISSYREGSLIRGAIRTALPISEHVIVFEGPTENQEITGDESDYNVGPTLHWVSGEWKSESEKRTAMINEAKLLMRSEFWVLILDADEILVWGEHLQDYLAVLNPGPKSEENIPRFLKTEMVWVPPRPRDKQQRIAHAKKYGNRQVGWWTDHTPSHLYHSSLIQRYIVGAWQIETPEGKLAVLDNTPAANPPAMGEPHIHHRPYLRRFERAGMRLHKGEEQRWMEERGLERHTISELEAREIADS